MFDSWAPTGAWRERKGDWVSSQLSVEGMSRWKIQRIQTILITWTGTACLEILSTAGNIFLAQRKGSRSYCQHFMQHPWASFRLKLHREATGGCRKRMVISNRLWEYSTHWAAILSPAKSTGMWLSGLFPLPPFWLWAFSGLKKIHVDRSYNGLELLSNQITVPLVTSAAVVLKNLLNGLEILEGQMPFFGQ